MHARYLTLAAYGGGQLPKYPTINIYPPFGPVAPPGFAFLLSPIDGAGMLFPSDGAQWIGTA